MTLWQGIGSFARRALFAIVGFILAYAVTQAVMLILSHIVPEKVSKHIEELNTQVVVAADSWQPNWLVYLLWSRPDRQCEYEEALRHNLDYCELMRKFEPRCVNFILCEKPKEEESQCLDEEKRLREEEASLQSKLVTGYCISRKGNGPIGWLTQLYYGFALVGYDLLSGRDLTEWDTEEQKKKHKNEISPIVYLPHFVFSAFAAALLLRKYEGSRYSLLIWPFLTLAFAWVGAWVVLMAIYVTTAALHGLTAHDGIAAASGSWFGLISSCTHETFQTSIHNRAHKLAHAFMMTVSTRLAAVIWRK
jgi:hypothetical protein